MKTPNYKIKNNGDSALTIIFEEPPSESLTRKLIPLCESFRLTFKALLLDIIPSYQSITLHFDPLKLNKEIFIKQIKHLLALPISASAYQSKTIEIPVCYEDPHATDLSTVANHCHMSKEQVISTHLDNIYLVHMLGFLPGFLYLGGLSKSLYCPRKEVPAKQIIAGSVAIGGNQTGIYPVNSPGGWHVIGRTPISIFDPYRQNPAIASPLDKIRFIQINDSDFIKLQQNQTEKTP